MAAVVGNPRLPPSVMDRWLWGPMPSAEEEAHMVADLLGCQPLAGPAATKERVMSALTQAECAHFATHISWKLAALVLTPSQDTGSGPVAAAPSGGAGGGESGVKSNYTIPESLRMPDDASDAESICDSPPLQEFLLTAADILDLRLPTKLVVLGSVNQWYFSIIERLLYLFILLDWVSLFYFVNVLVIWLCNIYIYWCCQTIIHVYYV